MTNQEVAKKLREVYNLMQLAGENRFRAIAFDRAAQTIEGLNDEILTYIKEDSLTDIKGIGKSIAEDIKTFHETGTMPVLEDLKKRVPKGLIEWTNISGLGPKNIVKIHKELGITTISELREACQSGAVADLPGLGKKSAEKIIKSIEYLEQYGERCLLNEALEIAEPIFKFVRNLDGVIEAEIAGSLRRSRETIGDIDILVAAEPKNTEDIFDAFVNHELVVEILGRGDTKSSVRSETGRQVDLRIVKPDEYPAALMYFTGSKEHNIVLRQRARDRGMALNEYGLFKLTDDKDTDFDQPVESNSESEIYQKLGLNFIIPEHREDRNEFKYYEDNEEMELVQESDIRGVVHAHSTWSDGKYSIKQMAEASMERGYEYLGISDHSKTAAYAGGLSVDEVKQQWDEIDQLNEEFLSAGNNFKIFKGIESDILADGSLDYPVEILEGFDFVIASVHSSLELPLDKMMKRFENAIKNPFTRILGHPTGRLLLRREEGNLDLNKLIELAARENTAIEINANPRRLDLDWRYGNKAQEVGLMTSINPDAHTTDGIDDIRYGVMIARKGKYSPDRVLNTKSSDQFEQWLKEEL
ncbi:DNA polymerase/3'-5' exonuclease PolX [Rhodohalobacter sulfatireducens]|uniref:DNA polymerase beta n=1 Tax=Rhodohalobacter sulfatireducens TaxID=2911366 RepID=A0ABS9KHK9_9BACT|nr:DNA polymerase/3'-5' exonuclease PolX [Rhodohalobacter sulfatireducens]MCG2590337.1 DNA polymerase/3'-5' exonuclease PolX [Rhodohalobacter sulfatireducens]